MQNDFQKIKIGITIGDINGVGIELIIKTFQDERMFDLCIPIIYGSSKLISFYRKILDITELKYNNIKHSDQTQDHTLNVINCWEEEVKINIGEATEAAGKYAYKSIEAAVNDLKKGEIDALITAPINKYVLQKAGMNFIGHTEYLSEKFDKQESLMLLASEELKFGILTTHVPVKDIVSTITVNKILNKLKVLKTSLIQDFGIEKPKIAVLGLNPHAGDTGLIGREEIDIITPAIRKANENNILAFGPYSADGFFGAMVFKKFDATLVMYHDQGLIPFKTLAFNNGVNYTAGLPVIRTSPDHGTAYEIAGKNIASPESFRNSIFLSIDIFNNRKNHEEIHKNPLQKRDLLNQAIA